MFTRHLSRRTSVRQNANEKPKVPKLLSKATGLLIYGRLLTGQVVPLPLEEDSTVGDLKREAERAGGPPVALQMVLFGRQELAGDHTPLSETNLSSDATVEVCVWQSVRHISCGNSHGLVVQSDGQLCGWGKRWLCTLPDDLDGAVASLHAGYQFSAAMMMNGRLVLWGHTKCLSGETFDGRTPSTTAVNCSASVYHNMLGVVGRDANLYFIGTCQTRYGEVPAELQGHVAGVSLGEKHVVVLTDAGTVHVFGASDAGFELSYNDLGGCNAVGVSAGRRHFAVRLDSGAVRIYNYDGEFVTPDWSDVRSVSCGDGFTVALLRNGVAVCYGRKLLQGLQPGQYTAVQAGLDWAAVITKSGRVVVRGHIPTGRDCVEYGDVRVR